MSRYRTLVSQLQSVYSHGEAAAVARLVMEEHFGLSQTDLLLGKDNDLSANDLAELQNIAARLLKNEPVQYILGYTSFCGLQIGVQPGVLIPRPETAELVEWVSESLELGSRILDIGTGSGCIALALASKGYQVEAWDVSDEALAIAAANAQHLQQSVKLRKQDVLALEQEMRRQGLFDKCNNTEQIAERFVAQYGQFDAIVSNPPYICENEKPEMESNVLDYEPGLALFVPDNDPLLFYRAIVNISEVLLKPSGLLFFEINRAFGDEVKNLSQSIGYKEVELRYDQFGNARFVKSRTSK